MHIDLTKLPVMEDPRIWGHKPAERPEQGHFVLVWDEWGIILRVRPATDDSPETYVIRTYTALDKHLRTPVKADDLVYLGLYPDIRAHSWALTQI